MANKFIFFLLFLCFFAIFFMPVYDTDFGWHYRCGEQFITNLQLCKTNNFSYFLPNYQWYYQNFLYDTSLALIFDHFGFLGISFLGAGVFSLIYILLYQLIKLPIFIKIVFIFLSVILGWNVYSLGFRPQIFATIFVLLELFLLEKRKLLITIPLLILIWVNIHPSFFLGILILLLYAVDRIIRDNRSLYKSCLLVFFGFIASGINYFGFNVYLEIFRHYQAPLNTMIAEWVSSPELHIILIILGTVSALVLAIVRKNINYRLLLLLIFAFFAIGARRNLPLFYPILFLVISENISLDKIVSKKAEKILNLLTILIFVLASLIYSTRSYDESDKTRYPSTAIKLLEGKTGNIFNTYEWGGYLIWKLPKMKVFVDGRMPAWKDDFGRYPYNVFLAILQTQPGWNEELRKNKTDYILIGQGTFLDLLLKEESKIYGWQEIYRDQVAVLYQNVLK